MSRDGTQLILDTTPAPAPPSPQVRLLTVRRQAIETGRNRLAVTAAVFAMLFLVVAGRLVHLAVLGGAGEPTLARSHGEAAVVASRADIVDRNGELLASNLTSASLFANPRMIDDAAGVAAKLAAVLPDIERSEVLARLSSDRSFVWIKRHLTPKQQYQVNSLGLPGLAFQAEQRRVYPDGPLFAQVLGYTGIDNRGLAGIEKYFDDELSRRAAAAAKPLQLALDVRVQHALKDELARAVRRFHAIGGAGLVLDARSGELLAMVSLPDFDPNQLDAEDEQARFNRATLGVYELGSVFKIFTAAMALDNGTVSLADGYDASQPIHVARYTIRDDHPKKRWLSVPEIFVYSSNIGAAKMALDVGGVEQKAFLDRLGLLRRPDLELPEVGLPLYPSRWRDINTMTIAFGHGIAVSPLQLVCAVAATVNGGVLVRPTLLKQERAAEPVGERVMSARTSTAMRRLMRLVVEQGTGKQAAAPGYLVGGKTGTAEKIGAAGYQRRKLVSSFVGAFPMNAPRYIVFALLDEPEGIKETYNFATAGWTSAPVVARVVTRIAPLLGIAPVDEAAPDIQREMSLPGEMGKAKLASF